MDLRKRELKQEIMENEKVLGKPVKVGQYTLVPVIDVKISYIEGSFGIKAGLYASVSPKGIVVIKGDEEIGILPISGEDVEQPVKIKGL